LRVLGENPKNVTWFLFFENLLLSRRRYEIQEKYKIISSSKIKFDLLEPSFINVKIECQYKSNIEFFREDDLIAHKTRSSNL